MGLDETPEETTHPTAPLFTSAQIAIIAIVAVAVCFIGVEVYLLLKKKKAKQS